MFKLKKEEERYDGIRCMTFKLWEDKVAYDPQKGNRETKNHWRVLMRSGKDSLQQQ